MKEKDTVTPTPSSIPTGETSTPTSTQSGKVLPVPRKIRGTLTILAEDDMEFRAQRNTGISSQEQLAKNGESKLYKTVGEKQQKIVAHISIPNNSSDPRADLYDQVEKLAKVLPDTGRKEPRLRGRSLLKEKDVQVVCNQKEKQLQITMNINVEKFPDFLSRLLTLMQKVSQCFATNLTFLAKLRK